jgi:hypothetical protein
MSYGSAPFSDIPYGSLPAAAGAGSSGPAAWTEAVDTWAAAGSGTTTGVPAWTEAVDGWAATGSASASSAIIVTKMAPFFATDTITTAGYQLYHDAAGVLTADKTHNTSAVQAIPNVTNGYCVEFTATMLTLDSDGGYRGLIVWDSGGGSPFYVADEVYVPPNKSLQIDLAQTVPTSNTAQTVGDALNAARAQGFGKWSLLGTVLTLYAGDGATVVRTFTLDSATSPTSRQ